MSSDTDSPSSEDELPDLASLEKIIGHAFRDRSRLLTAVTHRSFAHESLDEDCEDNEALEFLGDAVLSYLVADRLFSQFPGLDEGRLSKHKSMIEKGGTLAEVAGEIGLGEYLHLGRGERRSGGARNQKILSNLFEAVVAATYLDGGLSAVQPFVDRTLGPRIAELDGENPISDYKSALQEVAQALGLGTPVYEVRAESGPDHQKRFTVAVLIDGRAAAEGEGMTKRAAQQVAARRALAQLRKQLDAAREAEEPPGPEPDAS